MVEFRENQDWGKLCSGFDYAVRFYSVLFKKDYQIFHFIRIIQGQNHKKAWSANSRL
jgi:hypothetical protein